MSSKLTQLRESLQSPEVIKHAFVKADANDDGELDTDELIVLMGILGSTMTNKEAETCLEVMDKPDKHGKKNGKISLDEFLRFMERNDQGVLF